MARLRGYEGRHKACPYRGVRGGWKGGARVGTRAGTRPAPTGALWGRGGGRRAGWARAGTRPAPTGALWGEGEDDAQGEQGQAQGLPLQVPFGGEGEADAQGGRGQAQGLPLQELCGGRPTRRVAVGRHKACPYRSFVGGGRRAGWLRAGTRPAPTGALWGEADAQGSRGQAQGLPLQVLCRGRPTRRVGEGRHRACPCRSVSGSTGGLA